MLYFIVAADSRYNDDADNAEGKMMMDTSAITATSSPAGSSSSMASVKSEGCCWSTPDHTEDDNDTQSLDANTAMANGSLHDVSSI